MPHHWKPAVWRETVAYIMGKHSASAARSRSLRSAVHHPHESWTRNPCTCYNATDAAAWAGLSRAAISCLERSNIHQASIAVVDDHAAAECILTKRHKVQAQSLWLGSHTHITHARTDERTHARACVHVSMHGACRGTKHSTRSLAGRVDENDLGAPSRSFCPSACTPTTKALRWKRHHGRAAGPPYAGAAAEETVETARSRISSASMAEYGGRVHGIKSVGVLGTDVGLPLSCRFAIYGFTLFLKATFNA